MNEWDIKKVLQTILQLLPQEPCVWRVEWSANLKIQGIDLSVQDIDITTNKEGIQVVRDALKKYIIHDAFNTKIDARSLVCKMNNFEIEINYYNDSRLHMFDNIEEIVWNDLPIPILPLEHAKMFYTLIGRKKKADIISTHLSD